MHKEYAVEPKLFAEWESFRYLFDKFGWSKGRLGRLLSEFPRGWKKCVYEEFDRTSSSERKIQMLVDRLDRMNSPSVDDFIVKRSVKGDYDPTKTWIDNSLNENGRAAFQAIIASEAAKGVIHYDTMLGDDLEEHSGLSSRKAVEMAEDVKLLLQNSEQIVFIDPHFTVEKRFTEPLSQFLKLSSKKLYKRKPPTYELHLSLGNFRPDAAEEEKSNRLKNLQKSLRDQLPKYLPQIELKIVIRKEKDKGIKFHNRYILTEKAGVSWGTGLDSTKVEEDIDDLFHLKKEQCIERFKHYSGDTFFDILDEFTIFGECSE